jgi:hypothetical protein
LKSYSHYLALSAVLAAQTAAAAADNGQRLALLRCATCAWRIRKFSHKCIGAGSLVTCRHRATVRIDDSPAHSRRASIGHHRQTHAPGWSARCRGRISDAKAPIAHQQSRTATCTEPELPRSIPPGSWITVCAANPNLKARGHYFASIGGSPTCAYSRSKRSSRLRRCPCPIRLWNG